MKTLLTLILFVTFFLFSLTIRATNYYFSSSSGDDSRTITQAQNPTTPWQTLSKLNSLFSTLQPGDSILFKRGDSWIGSITINKSGSAALPIIFGAYGSGAKPIISGLTVVSSWTNDGSGIYESVVSSAQSTLNIVTRDDVFQPMGRYPKLTDANGGYLFFQSHSGTSSITSSQITSVPNFTGGEVVLRASHWRLNRGTITNQSSTNVSYTPIAGNHAISEPADNFGFFFQNHVNTLTQLGEWCYESASKKLKVYFGSNDPSSYSIKASTIDNLITISSKAYITFDNLAFTGANSKAFNISSSNNLQINNCDLSFCGVDGIYTNGCTNIQVNSSTIIYCNDAGIYSEGSPNWTINHNTLDQIGMNPGMGVSGDGAHYSGIAGPGNSSLVQYNNLSNIGSIGITYAGSITIQYNFVNGYCNVLDDGGGVYTYTNTSSPQIIQSNILLNGNGAPNGTPTGVLGGAGNGIYIDDNSANVSILNNTVANCQQLGSEIHNSSNVTISGNTYYNNGKSDGSGSQIQLTEDHAQNLIRGVTMKKNIFFSALDYQSIAQFYSENEDINSFGVFDSNYYVYPLIANPDLILTHPSSGTVWRTLSQWQSYSSQDQHSKKSPKTISNVNQIRFEYNATFSNKVVNLGATYIGVDSTIYSGTITLAPYTSAVLIYLSGVIANQSPVANAGPDQNFFLPTNTTTLTGTGTDADGTIASYQWTKISGPSQYAIVSPTQAQTVINNLVQGTYQFQLTVTDNLGATGKDTVAIIVNAAPNQSPTANAGPDQNITLPTNSVTVVGSGTDPDGSISSYQWTKISGPTQYTIATATQAQTSISNLAQGVYQFELKVTDNLGATGKDTVVITANAAPNQPPVANAGPDQNINLPLSSVTLNGSGTDADGTVVSYQWTKISGPSLFTILSVTQALTIINTLIQGTYQFELKVTDNLGAVGRDTVAVTVNLLPNLPPVANAGLDKIITLPTNTVTVTGAGTDADGTIASYQWTKISGPTQYTIATASQSQTAINNLIQGVYQFELKVTDNAGATARDTIMVTVNPAPNQPPTANADLDKTITLPTNNVTLTGSGTDADGTIASYQWTKISGPTQYTIATATQSQTVINNLIQGIYQFELKVTDNAGATGRDTVIVTVNQPPVANAGLDMSITLPTNSVTLTGSGTDVDGTIASYQWTKISGSTQYTIATSNQAQTAINNLVQGIYQFELKVTDNVGATGRDTVTVTVNPAPNQPPTANSGSDKVVILPTNSVTLTGSGTDVDGTIASYQWTKISGSTQYTIVSATQSQTAINNLVQGVYQFELKVTDNQGATGRDTVMVTVDQPPVANAGSDVSINLPTSSVTLTGSGTDVDGTITSYQWTRISGPTQYTISTATQSQTAVNNLVQGVYQFELKVTDNLGAIGRDTVKVIVNQPPTADAGSDIIITLPTNSVTLTGSGTDIDGTIVSYSWTKISGPTQFTIVSASQAQTIINNLIQGVYQFQLTVTDDLGATGKDIIEITVNNASTNQPPSADGGPDVTITLPTNSVTLSGSGTDPDGTIASYQWTKISGPSQYTIVSASQAQTVINNLAQGVYQFQLRVTDNLNATGRDTVVVTVNNAPANQPPTANAGADTTITLPVNNVTLHGSGTDVDGTIVSYRWSKISGPTQYTIVSNSQAQTAVNNLIQGVYEFSLRVTDNSGAIGRDTVIITVNAAPNQPPTVNAGSDKVITLPTNSVTLTGIGTDVDGAIASYQWTKISGPAQYTIASATQSQTAINNLIEGVYQFELKVTDNLGATGTDTVLVTVNQPPVANAGLDISITLPTNNVTLTGSGTDADGTIASYQWTKISGPIQYTINTATQSQTAVNNFVQGVYQFELTVTDNLGGIGKDTVQVTVNPAPNQPPTANAGLDKVITLPTNTVTLTGSGADADGTIASYQWTKISGPTQYTIISATQSQTVINNLIQGIYQFELKVTDNLGATGTDTVMVTVNQPPVANAGLDISITLPTSNVTLTGIGTDIDGTIASYQWTKISGPTQYAIANANQAQTAINNLVQGVYQFELKVTDNFGATGRDTVVVTVNAAPNQPPTVNAGADKTITLPTNSVTLTGVGTDVDGMITSYQWTKISGPTQYTIVSAIQSQTVINNLIEGVYQFELKATDNAGATGRDTVTVTVNPAPNQPPTANAGTDKIITLPTNSVTLTGSGTDVDGTIASYQWTKISGPTQYTIATSTQAQTAINNLVQGVYQFELKVTDNRGATDRDTVRVTVNQPPVANAGLNMSITLPTNSVTLTGSGTDGDGTIASYQWTKISGPTQYTIATSTQAQTAINNLVQGVYQFELKVTDNLGGIGKDTVVITVNAAPNQPPTANAGLDKNITLPVNYVTLSGSGTDVDGTIASYQWTKISGPSQYTIVLANQAQTAVNNLVQGVYQFELKVTDNVGATGKDTVTVTVNPAPNQPPTADAGIDMSITLPANSVTLTGTGTDVDGTIASYLWTKVSGPTQYTIASSNQRQTLVNNLVQGVYQFELKVTDNLGAIGKDTILILVYGAPQAPNQAPIADAGSDHYLTLPTNSTIMTGVGTDPDGMIASYKWSYISGPSQYFIVSPTAAITEINDLVEGTYQFELQVTDNVGAIGKDTVNIIVAPENVIKESTAKVYPNPATTTLNVEINSKTLVSQTSIDIYNSVGIKVYHGEFLMSQQKVVEPIDISSYTAGVYIIKVGIDTDTTKTIKFVKQ